MRYTKIFGPVICTLMALFCLFALFGCNGGSDDTAMAQDDDDVEKKLADLGITLTQPSPPTANYVRTVRTGNLVFLSGHGPSRPAGGGLVTGKVGGDLSLEQGQEAARFAAISLLSSLKAGIGDLNKVNRIVRVFGMVNAVTDFTQHSQVMNGCSDLLVSVFGMRGKHVRAAVGMGSLPRNMAVEIEMLVELKGE